MAERSPTPLDESKIKKLKEDETEDQQKYSIFLKQIENLVKSLSEQQEISAKQINSLMKQNEKNLAIQNEISSKQIDTLMKQNENSAKQIDTLMKQNEKNLAEQKQTFFEILSEQKEISSKQIDTLTKIISKQKEILSKEIDDLKKMNESFSKRSKTYTQSFRNFEKTSFALNSNEKQNLHFINPIEAKLLSVWNELKSLRLDFLDTGLNEKSQVHPFVENLLKVIINTFGNSLSYHHEAALSNPVKIPDFVLSARNVTRPSWADCLGSVECKKFSTSQSIFVSGGGQSVEYCVNSFDSINVPNVFRFSAVTDGFSIQFFVCSNITEKKKFMSQVLELCPMDIEQHNSSRYSEGLKLLCQMIIKISEEALTIPITLKIKGEEFNITSSIKRCVMTSNVCVINRNGVECVIKYSDYQSAKNFFIRREFKAYKILELSDVKLLKLDADSSEEMLIFKDIGIDLKTWCKSILAPDDLERKIKFLNLFKDILDNIFKLHRFGYTHGDVRTENILVFETGYENPDPDQQNIQSEAVLIDLACVEKIGTPLLTMYGTTMFMSQKLIENTLSPFYYLTLYDLESFVYTFLDCISPELFENISLQFIPSQEAYGNELLLAQEHVAFRNKFILENLIVPIESSDDAKSIDNDLLNIFIQLFNESKSLSHTNVSLEIYDKFSKILTI